MAGPTIASAEVSVSLDGDRVVIQARSIAAKAGNAMDKEMSKSGTKSGKTFADAFNRGSKPGMDRTVALVLKLISSIGPQIAGLGSALSAQLVGVLSSAIVGLGGTLIALGGVMSALVVSTALVISGWKEMVAQSAALRASQDALSDAWERQANALGSELAPALASFLDALAKALGSSNIGSALGQSLATITTAFEGVVNSPAFQAFLTAMETTLPKALAGFGTGIAGLIQGFLQLFASAGPAAQVLGEQFAAFGENFATVMQQMAASGQLSDFFDQAVESINALFGLINPLAVALGNVFLIGSETGNQLLGILGGLAEDFLAFTQSAEGSSKIGEWFSQSVPIFESLIGLIGSVGTTLADMVTPAVLGQVADFLDTLAEVVPIAGEVLSVIGEANLLNVFAQGLLGIGNAITPLLPALSTLAQWIGSLDPSVIQTIAVGFAGFSVVGKLAPIFKTLGSVFKPVFQALKTAGPIIGRLAPAFRALVGALGGPIGLIISLGSALIYFLTQTETGKKVVQGFVDFFKNVWQGLTDWFTGTALPVLQGVWDAIIAGVQAVGDFFGTAWQAILDAPQAVVDWFTGTLVPFFTGIPEAIGGALSSVGGAISGAFQSVLNWFTGTLLPFFANLPAQIGQFLLGVVDFFIQLPFRIIDALINLPFQIAAVFSAIWNTVIPAVTSGVQSVISWFAALPGRIVSAVTSLASSLATWATNVWTTVRTVFTQFVNNLVSFVTQLPGRIVRGVSNLVSTLGTWARNVWTTVRNVFTTLIGNIVSFVTQLPGRIVRGVSSLASSLASWATNAWNAARNAIVTVAGNIVSFVTGLPGRIISALSSLASSIGSFFRDAFQRGYDGMSDRSKAIIDYVAGIPGRILSGLGNVGRLLWDAGSSIMSSLLDGLTAGWNKVSGWVSGVGDKIRDLKGPLPYDRKLLIPAGHAIMDGLGEGLTGGWRRVAGFVGGVAGEIPATFRKTLQIHSPSKVMFKLGEDTVEGFIRGFRAAANRGRGAFGELTQTAIKSLTDGLQKGSAEAGKESQRILAKVRDIQISAIKENDRALKNSIKSVQKADLGKAKTESTIADLRKTYAAMNQTVRNAGENLRTTIKNNARQLTTTLKDYESVQKQLESARKKLDEMKKLRSSVADSIRGQFNLGDLVSTEEGAAKPTFANVASYVSGMKSKAQTFANRMKKLVAAGIPPAMVQQIAGLGLDGAIQVSDALLQGSPAQLRKLKADFSAFTTATTSVGDSVVKSMYGLGVQAQQGIINGLVNDSGDLKKAAKTFTDRLTKYVRQNLGIKSPSRVFASIGEQVMNGMTVGIQRGASGVLNAVGSVASSISSVSPSVSTSFGTSRFGGAGVAGVAAGNGRTVVVQEGAIQVVTPLADPYLVASQVLDRMMVRAG